MWYTSEVASTLHHAADYGFGTAAENDKVAASFNWHELKTKRDAYIHRLNGI